LNNVNDSQTRDDLKPIDAAASHLEYIPLIARGAGIVYAGSIVGAGLRYLYQVIVARHLGVEMFGLFTLGFAVFNIASVMASLGTSRGVVRYVSLYQGEGDQRRVRGTIILAVWLSLGGGIVASLLLILLSETLAVNVYHAVGLTDVLRFFAIAIPFSALTTVFLSSTQALRIMKYRVYVRDVFELLSRIILALLMFLLGWKLWGALFAFLTAIAASTLLSFHFYRKAFHAILRDRVRPIFEPRSFLAYCWPLFVSSGIFLIVAWIPTLILGYFSNPETVGVFSAVYRTSLLVEGILLSFNTVFAPIISDLHHREESRKLEILFKVVGKWIFALSFPPILLMMIFSQEILSIFGRGFAVGATSLIILSIGQLANSVGGPLGVMIDMSGRSKITLLNSVFLLLLQTVLCLLLIPRYSIVGAALAKALSIGSLRVIRLLQVHFILKVHPFRAEYLKPLVAGGASWLVLSLIRTPALHTGSSMSLVVLGSLIFLVIYGLVLYRLGFDEEDKAVIQTVKTRFAF
jgi:O-antigen/teichoic acid export membrane protein